MHVATFRKGRGTAKEGSQHKSGLNQPAAADHLSVFNPQNLSTTHVQKLKALFFLKEA